MTRFGRRPRAAATAAALAGVLALAACGPAALRAPAPDDDDPRRAEAAAKASEALRAYYERIERNYLARGLLRRDGGGPDTPVTARQLVDNFIRIALHEEFANVEGRMVQSGNATLLHRWEKPVRIGAHFGDSVPQGARRQATDELARYAERLSRLTRLPVRVVKRRPNFHVFFVDEGERWAIERELERIPLRLQQGTIDAVRNMRRSAFCLVAAASDGEEVGIYSNALVVIRAEHPDLLRLSCIHEELAQGLGLFNDSPFARPSVFNDDEEFALLTFHDEHLLRILYDPRMRPGMSAGEARPIAEAIAGELLRDEG